jgi:hypothetical protein
MSEFDSPWKEALEQYLSAFLAYFFPPIHNDIDWSRGYETLDKELEQIVREAEMGTRLADKLFKVWRKDGMEAWILIHVEIQAQHDAEFVERMYVYNDRIYDRFRRPVVSLAVLGDESTSWRPSEFGYNLWGFDLRMRFPVVKLLDYAADLVLLEAQPSPFGLIVLAHLQCQQTRHDDAGRYAWKVRLMKGLLDRGLEPEMIRQLLRLIDWLLNLPPELEQLCRQEVHEYAQEKKMPYVSSFERLAREEGREEGRVEGWQEGRQEGRQEGVREGLLEAIAACLRREFGTEGAALLPDLRQISDLQQLRDIGRAVWEDKSLEKVRRLIGHPSADQPASS